MSTLAGADCLSLQTVNSGAFATRQGTTSSTFGQLGSTTSPFGLQRLIIFANAATTFNAFAK